VAKFYLQTSAIGVMAEEGVDLVCLRFCVSEVEVTTYDLTHPVADTFLMSR